MLNMVQTSKKCLLPLRFIRFSKVDRSQKPFDLRDKAFFRGEFWDFQSCAMLGYISPNQGDTMSKKVTKVFGLIVMGTMPLSVGKLTFQRHVFAKCEVLLGAKWSRWSPRIECQIKWHRWLGNLTFD